VTGHHRTGTHDEHDENRAELPHDHPSSVPLRGVASSSVRAGVVQRHAGIVTQPDRGA